MSKITLGKITVNDLANRDPGVTTEPALTSPRSSRVCLERGVEPAMLVPKRFEDFAAPNLTAEHQRVKWDRHEQTRLQRVVVLNEARDRLPEVPVTEARLPGVAGAGLLGGAFGREAFVSPGARMSEPGFGSPGFASPATMSPYSPPKRRTAPLRPTSAPAGGRSSITAVNDEERRVEAARRRTEKQLAVLTAAKATAERRRAAYAAKIAQAKRVDDALEQEKARVERERCEKVFQDLQRQKEDAKQFEEQKKRDSEARFQQRQEALREQREREEHARLLKAEEDARRQRKMDEFHKRTEAIAQNKKRLLSIKDREMRDRERQRMLAKEEERRVLFEQSEQRRKRFETRLESARSKHEHLTEKKRLGITQKNAKAALRAMTTEEQEQQQRLEKQQKLNEKQQFRDTRYNEAKNAERARSGRLMRKQQEEDEALRAAQKRRQEEFELDKLERRMSLEEKREKVEMATRRKQYKASLLLEKIERETQRAKALNAAREELAQQRRLNNDELSLERTLLMRADPREIRRVQSFKAKHSGRPQSARPATALRSPYASPYGNTMSPRTPKSANGDFEFF